MGGHLGTRRNAHKHGLKFDHSSEIHTQWRSDGDDPVRTSRDIRRPGVRFASYQRDVRERLNQQLDRDLNHHVARQRGLGACLGCNAGRDANLVSDCDPLHGRTLRRKPMRILITVLLFLRVLDAAPTLLAHTSAHAQYTFSTSAIDTTGATLIVVAAGSYNGYSVALSDSQSNSWTALPSQMNSNERLTLYYCLLPATSSSHIFTLTGGAPYGSLVVEAWNGISGVDVSTGNNVGDSINTYQIGPILPAKNGDLVVAALLANFQYAPPLGISID